MGPAEGAITPSAPAWQRACRRPVVSARIGTYSYGDGEHFGGVPAIGVIRRTMAATLFMTKLNAHVMYYI